MPPVIPRLGKLFSRFTSDDLQGFLLGALLIGVAVALLFFARPKSRIVARLKGVTWRRNQFCRGWLITGDTGSGKTSSGINQLAHQVFKNVRTWGGLCIEPCLALRGLTPRFVSRSVGETRTFHQVS